MEKMLNKKSIIIIALVVLIAVAGAVLAASTIVNKKEATTVAATTEQSITGDELDALLEQQPMFADGIKYYYASSSEQLSHDTMGASVFNNSDVNIQSFVVAFCAYDENDNPIKIKQPDDKNDGAYIRTISYDLSKVGGDKKFIQPQESFDNVIFYVTNDPQIVTIKACVKSYTSVDNISWENPFYETFKNVYSGKQLQPTQIQ